MECRRFHQSRRTPDSWASVCRECASDYGTWADGLKSIRTVKAPRLLPSSLYPQLRQMIHCLTREARKSRRLEPDEFRFAVARANLEVTVVVRFTGWTSTRL